MAGDLASTATHTPGGRVSSCFHEPFLTCRPSGTELLNKMPVQGCPCKHTAGEFVVSSCSEMPHAQFHGTHVHAAPGHILAPSLTPHLEKPGDPSPADLSMSPSRTGTWSKDAGLPVAHILGGGAASTGRPGFGSREGVKSSWGAKWPWAWRLQEQSGT